MDKPPWIGKKKKKKSKDICVPHEHSPKVTSAEEDFINQVDKKAYSEQCSHAE